MLLIIFVKSDKWRIWPISPNTNSKKKMSIEVANGFTILSGHMDSSFKEKDPSFLNSSCTQRPLLLDFGISSYFSFPILKSVSVFFFFLFFRDAFFFLRFCPAWLFFFFFFLFFFFCVGIEVVDDANGPTVTAFDANHYPGN